MKESNNFIDTYVYLKYLLGTVFSPSIFKAVFAGMYVFFTFLFDANLNNQLIALFILILLDFVSGISAAVYNKEPIRSAKIKHTAIKLTAYYCIIAGAHLAETGLYTQIRVLDETVLSFFLLTELVSLLENVGRMGVDTPKGLINKLLDYKNKI